MNSDQTDIRPLPVWLLVYLGYKLRELESCAKDTLLVSLENEPSGIMVRLRSLLTDLERLELRDSDGLARMELRPLLFRLERRHDQGKNLLGTTYAARLQDALQELYSALQDEASRTFTYPVRPITVFRIERFIDEPSRLFGLPDNIEPSLPKRVESILKEAGRCFAVGFSQAAILFTLQATEAVVKYYYEKVTERKPGIRTWGKINTELGAPKHNCPPSLIKDLNDIVHTYRNPAMHADLEIERETSLEAWVRCSDAVQQMLEDLEEKSLVKIE